SPTDGPPGVLQELPVISLVDLPNTAFWHKSVGHRHFANRGAYEYDVYPRSQIHNGDSLVFHRIASAFRRQFAG
ncbi:hypothetical protein HAX54_015850, partial [Datura stramonium]|nr:hypothetical protein [Datura stramonium]